MYNWQKGSPPGYPPEKVIRFSHDWNTKLSGNYLTTIRLKSDKYQVGRTYCLRYEKAATKVKPSEVSWIYAVAEEVRSCVFNQLSDAMLKMDTGYDRDAALKIFTHMYKSAGFDPATTPLVWVLLRRRKTAEVEAEHNKNKTP